METLRLLSKIVECSDKIVYWSKEMGGPYYILDNYKYKMKPLGYSTAGTNIIGVSCKLKEVSLDIETGDLHIAMRTEKNDIYMYMVKESIDVIDIDLKEKTICIYAKGFRREGVN